jgi:hypothetical protein
MHEIEPYYNWRTYYVASQDERSPFYEREYSEFEFTNKLYDYLIHPQWDDIGSQTLFIKILMADYNTGYAIIELLGEWNDCINNDIMFLKRDIADVLIDNGINKFILIGENVLNFHASDDCYYEEWFEDVQENDGWIAIMNFRDHLIEDFEKANIDNYFLTGGSLSEISWRTKKPEQLFQLVEQYVQKRLSV